MKGEKYNIKYSTEDIRKYLDGQLPEQEMQALEKAALEDPFLADAMEGIEESRNHKVSFESGVEDLQKRLTERIREKNRSSAMVLLFSRWRIAVSVIFILGLSIFALTYFNKKNSRTEIAKSGKNDSEMEKTSTLPNVNKTDTSARSPSIISAINTDSERSGIALNQKIAKEKRIRPKKLLSLTQNKVPDSGMIKPAENPVAYLSRPSIANDNVARITMDSEKEEVRIQN